MVKSMQLLPAFRRQVFTIVPVGGLHESVHQVVRFRTVIGNVCSETFDL
jgi:hypothetical protein